jgi:hypothetical protein|tara:strand:- start:152 stop:502 length:351 start_codon:yes stop_codon:yes gene_type:complete
MATTYKVITVPSVDHSSADTIYTVPGSTTALIMSLNICNRHSADTDVDIKLTSGTTHSNPKDNADVFLAKDLVIGVGSTLEILAGQKIVLNTGDDITIQAAGDNHVDVALSVMEIT